MRNILLLLFSFCTLPCLLAQANPFDGKWTGYLTQESGGFRPKYYFELQLEQKGNKVTGTSFSSVEDIYAEMALTGIINGDELTLKEDNIWNIKM